MSHSVYSFSSSHRWMNCPASIRMSKGYPNGTNNAAEIGTATHELGEFCIKLGIKPSDCIGLTFNNIVVNERMAEGAAMYRSVVDELTLRYGVEPLLEQRVVMTSLGRSDVYGTSDCTHIALNQRVLHTTDYKNGYGVVDVEDNSQTAGYSVATLDTFDLWDKVDVIHNTIIQPNYDHIDGTVRNVTYTIQDMIEWREKFRVAVLRADNPSEKPIAGEQCHYCPAQANCRARMELALKQAYTDEPIEGMSLAELELFYSEMGSIKRFLDSVAGRMLEEARKGANFSEFKLVESYSRATCHDQKALLDEVKSMGIDVTELFLDPKLVGKTRAEKIIGKELVRKHYKAPPKSSCLVPNSDRRPALRIGKASGIFSPIAQPTKSAEGVFGVIKQ